MSVFVEKHTFSYYPVPKCACTSLKLLAFQIENEFAFRIFHINGVAKYIHDLYVSFPFAKAKVMDRPANFRFTVVRDPIDRFLSAYSNRVLQYNELSEARLRFGGADASLAPRPDLGTFVVNLEQYRAADASVKHHTEPLTYFLGTDPEYFNRIYALKELDELVKWLEDRTGMALVLGHEQKGERKLGRSDLSAAEIERLQEFYAADYRHYGRFF